MTQPSKTGISRSAQPGVPRTGPMAAQPTHHIRTIDFLLRTSYLSRVTKGTIAARGQDETWCCAALQPFFAVLYGAGRERAGNNGFGILYFRACCRHVLVTGGVSEAAFEAAAATEVRLLTHASTVVAPFFLGLRT